nr:Mitochondrial group I intron splicing factor like [Ipomoea batatas]
MSKKNPNNHSGVIALERRSTSYIARSEGGLFSAEDFNFACGIGPGRLFMECLSLSSATRRDDEDDDDIGSDDRTSQISRCCSVTSGTRRQTANSSRFFSRSLSGVPFSGNPRQFRGSMSNNTARFGPKSRVLLYAPPSTVGGSALALHYANIIIVIEKLLCYPHLVGEEARNDLYLMLPTSIRKALKTNLKSYMNGLAIYDAPLAHGWKERLEETLKWLSPLAHNMIRWQSERNFEQQQQVVTRANVLLLQTLFFCDCKMTEAAICELLVGLNYICWYEHQQNALLDCASSFDLEDYMEW